jgi:hypothetical protein
MLFLFTDETNLTPDPTAKFFTYGGLIIAAEKFRELHEGIAKIRSTAGYLPTDNLKFDTRVRPKHIPVEICTGAKREVVQLCIALKCHFIVYVVLHAIGKNKSAEELVRWGANHVIGRFNHYCGLKDSYGAVVVDRLPAGGEYSYLTDKFTKGLEFPEDAAVTLDRIQLFAASTIGASHACSAMDIVLGSFRYCINEPKNVVAAKDMMGNIIQLLWHERSGDTIYALGRGLILAPKNIKVPAYKHEYEQLVAHINTLIAEME